MELAKGTEWRAPVSGLVMAVPHGAAAPPPAAPGTKNHGHRFASSAQHHQQQQQQQQQHQPGSADGAAHGAHQGESAMGGNDGQREAAEDPRQTSPRPHPRHDEHPAGFPSAAHQPAARSPFNAAAAEHGSAQPGRVLSVSELLKLVKRPGIADGTARQSLSATASAGFSVVAGASEGAADGVSPAAVEYPNAALCPDVARATGEKQLQAAASVMRLASHLSTQSPQFRGHPRHRVRSLRRDRSEERAPRSVHADVEGTLAVRRAIRAPSADLVNTRRRK
jgi:hypothetical protein